MEKIVIVGFGGHAKSVVDCIESAKKYEIIGYTDLVGGEIYHGYSYLGTDDELQNLYKKGIRNAVLAIGYLGEGTIRERLTEKLVNIGYSLPMIADPSAIIASSAIIGEGTFIGKHAIINSDARVGKMCIINSGAIIEHESVVEDYTHVSVGAVLCGRVIVGTRSLIGANATVLQNVRIGNQVTLGAGSIANCDIEDNSLAIGFPARSLRKHR